MSILNITTAGKKVETDALQNGTPVPRIAKLVIGAGTPPTETIAMLGLTQLVNQVYEADIAYIDRLSPTSMKLTASVPDNIECRIKEIGLVLEDGTLFAYAPYMPEAPDGGGMYKGRGFAWTIFCILSREQMGTVNFTYSPIDKQQLATEIANDARASLDLYLQSYFVSLMMLASALSATTQTQQLQINQLKTRLGIV